MTNSTNNISANINLNGQKLKKMASVKYRGATMCKDGTCTAEVRIRVAPAMAAIPRLNRIWWWCNTIKVASEFKPYKSLVTSILLNGCETRSLLADS